MTMNNLNKTAIAMLAASTAFSFPSVANERDILEIFVSGTRSEQPTVVIPASIQVLDAAQIKLSGASTLLQVLNAQAGIQINDNAGAGSRGTSVSMRGFGENNVNNVLVLVDGRKLNNPSLAAPDFSTIALKDVERVEITQGSAGTLYGDQATGGVINVITKRSEGMRGNLEVGRGTDDFELYRGSISQDLGNGVFYRISGEKKLGDNYRVNNEANYSNMLAYLGYEKDSYTVFAEVLRVEDDLNLANSLNRASINANRRQSDADGDFTNLTTDAYRIGGDFALSDDWTLKAEYTDRATDSNGYAGFSGVWSGSTTVETLSPRLVGNIGIAGGDILVTSGIDLQESDYQSEYTGADSEQKLTDFYAQAIVPVAEKMNMTIGGRYSELKETDNLTATVNEDDISVFQLGFTYQISAASRFFLRLDEGFRWANVDENGFSDKPAGEILDPQESSSMEVGIETRINNIALSALLYDMTIDNEIFYDSTAGYGANSNLEQSDRSGVVLDSSWAIAERVNVQLNYSYVDAEVSAGDFKGNTVPFVAKQTANFVATFEATDTWSVYVDAQHTGSRFGANDDANSGGKLGGYTVFNANINGDFEQLSFNFRANNLTGKKYDGFASIVYNYAYPAKGRTYEMTVSYNF